MMRKEVLQIRIEEDLKEKANLLAKKRHTNLSEMIRTYLEREVQSTYAIQKNGTQECSC